MCKKTRLVYDFASSMRQDTLSIMSDAYMLSCVMDNYPDVNREEWFKIYEFADQLFIKDNGNKELYFYINGLCEKIYDEKQFNVDDLKSMSVRELLCTMY